MINNKMIDNNNNTNNVSYDIDVVDCLEKAGFLIFSSNDCYYSDVVNAIDDIAIDDGDKFEITSKFADYYNDPDRVALLNDMNDDHCVLINPFDNDVVLINIKNGSYAGYEWRTSLELNAKMYKSNVEIFVSNEEESLGCISISNENFDLDSYVENFDLDSYVHTDELTTDIINMINNELVNYDGFCFDENIREIAEEVASHIINTYNVTDLD